MFNVNEVNGSVVVAPSQDVVASNVDELRTLLLGYLEKSQHDLVVDLDQVEMIDSSGLGVLIATQNSLKEKGSQLKVINVSGDIMGLFKIMRLDQHFKIDEKS